MLADDGQAPPLYMRGPGYAWGPLHATESLGPDAAIRRWKVLFFSECTGLARAAMLADAI